MADTFQSAKGGVRHLSQTKERKSLPVLLQQLSSPARSRFHRLKSGLWRENQQQ